MIGTLTKNQIEYVWYHFSLMYTLDKEQKKYFHYITDSNTSSYPKQKIVFCLSKDSFNKGNIFYHRNVPILFPKKSNILCSHTEENLIFHHDILKSAFFLLSGYQEYNSHEKDHLNRFPFERSVQNELSIIKIPVVNYYFEIIANEINRFFKRRRLKKCEKTNLFPSFVFQLSHDIDRVDYYTVNFLLFNLKSFFRQKKTTFQEIPNVPFLIKISKEILKFSKKENPYWDFEFLLNTEEQFHIKSNYYFLPKRERNIDASYSLREKRIVSLIKEIVNKGHEISLHGTVRSSEDKKALMEDIHQLKNIVKSRIYGIRHHRLSFSIPHTAILHQGTELSYDNTLLFASHEGFRNSFCLPFKLFDFDNDTIIDHWLVPLNVMDSTLFDYRKLNFVEAHRSVMELVEQVQKFNGVFSLLWHNGYFDETRKKPGLRKFYLEILSSVIKREPISLTGKELIDMVKKHYNER